MGRFLLPALLLLAATPACRPADTAQGQRQAALALPAQEETHAPLPRLDGRIADAADLLPLEVEARLSSASFEVERDMGAQFVIVTMPDLKGEPIDRFGVRLGRTWGIGHKDRNDGLMLIVAPLERKVRIEVGYGLEKRVTDAFAAKVIRETILPQFSRGDFPGGIEAGSAALIKRLRSKASDGEIAAEDGMVI